MQAIMFAFLYFMSSFKHRHVAWKSVLLQQPCTPWQAGVIPSRSNGLCVVTAAHPVFVDLCEFLRLHGHLLGNVPASEDGL